MCGREWRRCLTYLKIFSPYQKYNTFNDKGKNRAPNLTFITIISCFVVYLFPSHLCISQISFTLATIFLFAVIDAFLNCILNLYSEHIICSFFYISSDLNLNYFFINPINCVLFCFVSLYPCIM